MEIFKCECCKKMIRKVVIVRSYPKRFCDQCLHDRNLDRLRKLRATAKRRSKNGGHDSKKSGGKKRLCTRREK